LGELAAYEPAFSRFNSICARLTEFYFESRYPIFPQTDITEEEVQSMLAEAEELIVEIKRQFQE
jgi:hypothetical protein